MLTCIQERVERQHCFCEREILILRSRAAGKTNGELRVRIFRLREVQFFSRKKKNISGSFIRPCLVTLDKHAHVSSAEEGMIFPTPAPHSLFRDENPSSRLVFAPRTIERTT